MCFNYAISAGKTREALKLFHQYAEDNPKDLLSFVGLLHWQLKRLWIASVMLSEGQPEFAVMTRCKVFGSRQNPFMQQVKAASRAKLERAIEKLFHLDWALKTGLAEDRPALERWVVESTT